MGTLDRYVQVPNSLALTSPDTKGAMDWVKFPISLSDRLKEVRPGNNTASPPSDPKPCLVSAGGQEAQRNNSNLATLISRFILEQVGKLYTFGGQTQTK